MHWEKKQKSTKQKNNVFMMKFYWKIKGIQNSTNPLFYHIYRILKEFKWNYLVAIQWNSETRIKLLVNCNPRNLMAFMLPIFGYLVEF